MQITPEYHAPTFEPTVDEIETLKSFELGDHVSTQQFKEDHLSARLVEWGFLARRESGELSITPSGRQLIRRQEP